MKSRNYDTLNYAGNAWVFPSIPRSMENTVKHIHGRGLVHRYPYCSQSTATSFPSNSQHMVFCIKWEMIGFSHLISWENSAQFFTRLKSGRSIPMLLPSYGYLYFIKFPYMIYATLYG